MPDIEFIASDPERPVIRYGDNERPAGQLVCSLLRLFFMSSEGRACGTPCINAVTVPEVMMAVWGQDVSENTLWGLLRRSRAVLKDLGHPWLVYLEGNRVCIG